MTMMIVRITNRNVTQAFKKNYHLSIPDHLSKFSCAYHVASFHNKKGKFDFGFPLSKKLSGKKAVFYCAPASINMNQQRNFSNDMWQEVVKNFEEFKKSLLAIADSPAPVMDNDLSVPNLSDINSVESITPLTELPMVQWCQKSLLDMHEASGLPWWASIAVTAFLTRLAFTLPFAVTQMRLLAKLHRVETVMRENMGKFQKQLLISKKEFGWSTEFAEKRFGKKIREEWEKELKIEGCSPMQEYVLAMIQVPLWCTLTLATRNLCLPSTDDAASQAAYTEMLSGGFGWVTNLTVPDPYMVLPITLALINFTVIEIHQLFKVYPNTETEHKKILFLKALTLGLIPVAAYMPAAVNIYWIVSSSYGLVQTLLLYTPAAQNLFRVPVYHPKQQEPYKLFATNLRTRISGKAVVVKDLIPGEKERLRLPKE